MNTPREQSLIHGHPFVIILTMARTHRPHILITGRPGVGKTTLITRLIPRLPGRAAGFYTRERRDAQGRRIGFEIASLTGERGIMAGVDLKSLHRVGKYRVDIETIDRVGVQAIRHGLSDPSVMFIIMDEIATMELLSPSFRHIVLDALASSKRVIATIQQRSHPFLDQLRSRPDIALFSLTMDNRETMADRILTSLQWRE
ncbi:MAG: NTPase [Acidobacteria bacterium]|nr:MAG: NTPase [Acidobacteriota bacterium]